MRHKHTPLPCLDLVEGPANTLLSHQEREKTSRRGPERGRQTSAPQTLKFCGHGLRGRRQKRSGAESDFEPLAPLALSPRTRRAERATPLPLTYVGLRQLVRDHVEGGPLQVAHAGEPSELAAEVKRLVHLLSGGRADGGGGVAGAAGGSVCGFCFLGLVVQGVQPRKL